MSAFELTSLGKQEALNTTGRGIEFSILSTLYEADTPVEFGEITERHNLDDEKASMVLNKLIRNGRVKEV